MALKDFDEYRNPDRARPSAEYGVLLRARPSSNKLYIEIQRAPDSSGNPGTFATIARVGPFPLSGGLYFDPRPHSGVTWWYRARQFSYDIDPGDYTNAIPAIARRYDDARSAAAGRATSADSPKGLTLAGGVTTRRAEEDVARAGTGGVPVATKLIHPHVQYDATGAKPLIDTGTKQILPDLFIGAGVQGDSTVMFGGAQKFTVHRHPEILYGVNTNSKSFATSYENIPQVRVLPDTWTLPGTSSTSDRKIEMRASNVTVSGFDVRAVMSTGSTSTTTTLNPSATINGTTHTTETISAHNGVAFWNVSPGNSVQATYTCKYDIDTTGMGSGIVTIKIYWNNATDGSGTWTQVGSHAYAAGQNKSNETISFDAILGANLDIRILAFRSTGENDFTVTVKTCVYEAITGGSESTLTPSGVGDQLLIQAMEQT